MLQAMTGAHEQSFRAGADRIRRRIRALLSGGEVCVGESATIFELPRPTVSRHLAYPRCTRLVEVMRDGNRIFYRPASPTRDFHSQRLAGLTSSAEGDTSMRQDGH